MFKPIEASEPTHEQQTVDWRTGAISRKQVTGDNNSVLIPQRKVRRTVQIDMTEVARIQADRKEMMIKNAPNAAQKCGG